MTKRGICNKGKVPLITLLEMLQINAITQCGSECVGIARSLILQLIQGADFASQLCQSLHKFA